MAQDTFGVSFDPSRVQDDKNGKTPTPIQDAVRVLSLRVPSNVGPTSIAPGELLGSQAGTGIEDLLRRLFADGGMGPLPTNTPPPTPSVTPGMTAGASVPSIPTPRRVGGIGPAPAPSAPPSPNVSGGFSPAQRTAPPPTQVRSRF